MDELLHYVACILVDHTDDVVVESETDEAGILVQRLTVRQEDIGKVIGKQGRTARAMRNLMHAAAEQRQLRVNVQFVDA